MPTFYNSTPLSATDLNKLSAAQMWIRRAGGSQPFFYCATYGNTGETEIIHLPVNYVVRKWRYLFWWLKQTFTGNIVFTNYLGQTVSKAITSLQYGVVDLNVYSATLPIGMPYQVHFTNGVNVFVPFALYEMYHNTMDVVYPAAFPAFTSPSNATQLNGISTNLTYLMELYSPPIPSFAERANGNGVQFHRCQYWTLHRLPYLYVKATSIHDAAEPAPSAEFHIRINGLDAYVDSFERSSLGYSVVVHLDGTDHHIYEGGVHPITVADPPTYGEYYKVEIDFVDCESYRLLYLCEWDAKRGL